MNGLQRPYGAPTPKVGFYICFVLERTCPDHSQANAACPYRFDVLSVENPVVFAVLFEAAKAKSALCDNRACLAKNAIAFFACSARPQSGSIGAGPYARFLWFVSLACAKEMNNNQTNVRNLCSHSLHHLPRQKTALPTLERAVAIISKHLLALKTEPAPRLVPEGKTSPPRDIPPAPPHQQRQPLHRACAQHVA